jgi:uncharacterized protein YkwD
MSLDCERQRRCTPKVLAISRKTKVVVGLVSLLAALTTATAAQARALSGSEAELLDAMNTVRTSHGLVALRVDYHLVRAARGHSTDMMRHQYFAHGLLLARAVAAGARGPVFGENLAWSTDISARFIVDRWLASTAHRGILLHAGFRRVGISVVFGRFIGHDGAAVVTADFAGR